MTHAYINYPNPHITVHRQVACRDIGKMGKAGQRRIRIDNASVSHEFGQFTKQAYRFMADASANDMWLEIEFNDSAFELAVVEHVRLLIAARYSPFSVVSIEAHC